MTKGRVVSAIAGPALSHLWANTAALIVLGAVPLLAILLAIPCYIPCYLPHCCCGGLEGSAVWGYFVERNCLYGLYTLF